MSLAVFGMPLLQYFRDNSTRPLELFVVMILPPPAGAIPPDPSGRGSDLDGGRLAARRCTPFVTAWRWAPLRRIARSRGGAKSRADLSPSTPSAIPRIQRERGRASRPLWSFPFSFVGTGIRASESVVGHDETRRVEPGDTCRGDRQPWPGVATPTATADGKFPTDTVAVTEWFASTKRRCCPPS